MKIELFDFELPEELIAQTPLSHRDESKLLVLNRQTGVIEHRKFKNIIEYLQPGDALVLNDTKVLPARLYGHKKETGAKVEVLLLKQLDNNRWETLVKPGKKLRVGHEVVFGDGLLTGIVENTTEVGGRIIRFQYDGIFNEILDKLGNMPLPPYIKEQLEDKDRYQTVYAKNVGSSAAPTAGLHFTEELLNQIRQKGINIVYITLHVGLGTFRPVSVENIEEHQMHAEYFSMTKEAAETLNKTKDLKRKIIAVGTTSVRTLETIVDKQTGRFMPKDGWTDIFIYPGFEFKAIDGMITNFHLPKSSLVMLVSALAKRENIMNAYQEAIKNRYRFYSFGDAMFIY
ncbi:tRNA preQ1(34) S-adenosylmethionine ribosyltransferase-isomerase QueA [Vulcanibacillus modesticaldus]|uniref:S-adenosylmethionine:tRNA ribosyltransferase-isomerase n=1 Tax=Vulcanibacillus modesticaldus TaxID=337097 RepID=A0A1D2YWS4_9BACI|nr:tRNA preQ1(34) S-adenosylmethionine ribosyltransferase-isomerase QueA [Vulcanibacillus modesticaldus]OEG00211.1 tRNA preQ1(34) S-adenosylmethionine ribosyltransferase-isomerase QueA [Vulcanibacillus modesticaldus]